VITYDSDSNLLKERTNLIYDKNNDRLGVNQTTPQHTLDITGDLNLTGDIRSNGTVWNPTPVITANQIAYGTGSGITSENNFIWDSTNDRLGVN
jgi:hypothetical protein